MTDETQDFIADEAAPGRLRGLGVVLLVAMVAAAVLVLSTPRSGTVQAVFTVLALLLGGSVGVVLLVCRITVTVGQDAVSVAFWPVYRQQLAVGDLVSVRDMERVTPSMFGGSGLRRASGNRVALLFRAGPATEITTSTGRVYTVVVHDSEALTAAVTRLIEHGTMRG
ncbi:hypothetical protein [Cellulomonas sp. URHE0023]|uniref:hypothetical protein n=1 Tax=Cellulomonas sp. URHE0023 TaxID=1380354 RepID=UPI0004858F6D|nr:hypothetical protein [Cellulomonas sp. URHE0023]